MNYKIINLLVALLLIGKFVFSQDIIAQNNFDKKLEANNKIEKYFNIKATNNLSVVSLKIIGYDEIVDNIPPIVRIKINSKILFKGSLSTFTFGENKKYASIEFNIKDFIKSGSNSYSVDYQNVASSSFVYIKEVNIKVKQKGLVYKIIENFNYDKNQYINYLKKTLKLGKSIIATKDYQKIKKGMKGVFYGESPYNSKMCCVKWSKNLNSTVKCPDNYPKEYKTHAFYIPFSMVKILKSKSYDDVVLPNIECFINNIETEDKTVTITGRTIDESNIYAVFVNNIKANIDAQGYYNLPYSLKPDKNEITIKSFDNFGNSAQKNITITRKGRVENPIASLEEENFFEVGNSDVDKNIPKTSMDGSNTLCVIFGVEKYKYAPTVDYASNDARTFYLYAKKIFGIPERNIFFRTNENATSGEFEKVFSSNGWLARRIVSGETNIIIYYAGHGAPDTKEKTAYLIPYDIDPNYANTGLSLDKMYSELSNFKAKQITIFLDACFSGVSRSNEMLLAGVRGIVVKPKQSAIFANNLIAISASSDDEFSSSYPEKHHGLFTYYLLKSLKGEASNGNSLDIKTLFDYLNKQVPVAAGYLDRDQHPTIRGKQKDRILVEY